MLVVLLQATVLPKHEQKKGIDFGKEQIVRARQLGKIVSESAVLIKLSDCAVVITYQKSLKQMKYVTDKKV